MFDKIQIHFWDLPKQQSFLSLNLRLERGVFLKNFEKNFFLIFFFLLKRSFQGIVGCFEILIGSA